MITTAQLEKLNQSISGRALTASDASYDEVRKLHNGLIDKRPQLIIQCGGTADVVRAVQFAREHGLEIAVRGGGHNVAGRASVDNGMMVDLSRMTGVTVDAHTARARAQGGATWGAFNRETQVFGLGTTGGVISTTGIAGLTLGGGLGWTMGKYGMAVDNLVSAQVVTADAQVLTASKEHNPDLYWAIRGGGGNLGVVTSFEYVLHPIGMVTGGLVLHPVTAAREVLRRYRDLTASLPDELALFAAFVHAPDGAKLCAMAVCHCGPADRADKEVAPIKSFGAPAMVQVGPLPYDVMNTILDAGFPRGARNYWKSSFLNELTDAAIDIVVEQFVACPSPMSAVVLEHFHGAVTRIPVEATAYPHRQVGYNLVLAGQWMDANDDAMNIKWTRDSYSAMSPFMRKSRYMNYLDEDLPGQDVVREAYGSNYARLAEMKAKYDRDNVFHINPNVKPAAKTNG
jgi:FAD/FMN-containing dehydrogenase